MVMKLNVSQYKYLGIQFCASGSFSPAQKELYSKALKGYYKLRKDFISFGSNVKNSIQAEPCTDSEVKHSRTLRKNNGPFQGHQHF